MSDCLLQLDPSGLACKAGGFHIDPRRPVPVALLTHAHADHARAGSDVYFAHHSSLPILKQRLGQDTDIKTVEYGESLQFGPTTVSFHSAGHVLGSAQIRVEHEGEVWLVTGDFKRAPDPSCAPFEPVTCDTLICEATFALPIYRWPEVDTVVDEILDWWQVNRRDGLNSLLFCYAFGKAQRVLSGLYGRTDRPIRLHGAVASLVTHYADAGVEMAPTSPIDLRSEKSFDGELVIAPPGASGSTWARRFNPYRSGFCSGWMRVRGNRRRNGYDRGFVLSDHADWPALLTTISESRASRVLLTHGYADTMVRYLREQGIDADELR